MQISNHQYTIQDIPVLDIVQQFGTPLYVYDADKMVEKINQLRGAFPNVNLKIKFACKALTNISILKLMLSLRRNCNWHFTQGIQGARLRLRPAVCRLTRLKPQ